MSPEPTNGATVADPNAHAAELAAKLRDFHEYDSVRYFTEGLLLEAAAELERQQFLLEAERPCLKPHLDEGPGFIRRLNNETRAQPDPHTATLIATYVATRRTVTELNGRLAEAKRAQGAAFAAMADRLREVGAEHRPGVGWPWLNEAMYPSPT